MRLCMCPPHTTVIYLQSIHAHGVANNIFMSDFHVCVFAMHQITKNAYKMNVKKNHLFVCLFVVFYFHLQFLLLLLLFQRVSPIFICESVLCSHTHIQSARWYSFYCHVLHLIALNRARTTRSRAIVLYASGLRQPNMYVHTVYKWHRWQFNATVYREPKDS